MVMLTDLADVLRKGGLKVVEVPGWKQNARPASTGGFKPRANLWHHTGSKDTNPNSITDDFAYAKWLADIGRSDLPAPLCQVSIGRSGTVYVCAAGRGNHAGKAKAAGPVPSGDGNYLYLGWECQNTGSEGWSRAQYLAMVQAAAVTSLHYGWAYDANRAHKETSLTGKWDPGKLDMNKFRNDVRAEILKRRGVSKRPKTNVRVGHVSMQFSDTPLQMERDVIKLFKEPFHWITGTEAGEATLKRLLIKHGTAKGFVLHFYKSNWVAVKKDLIVEGTFKKGGVKVIDNDLVIGPGHDTGYAWVQFKNAKLGVINVAASHYPTKGRPEADDPARRVNLPHTRKIGTELGKWGQKVGAGSALAFVHADSNIIDRESDVFFGQPMTTCWDELKKWPDTGHGNIDIIASYDGDARVTCTAAKAYTDKEFFLHSDHYLVVARYDIYHLAA